MAWRDFPRKKEDYIVNLGTFTGEVTLNGPGWGVPAPLITELQGSNTLTLGTFNTMTTLKGQLRGATLANNNAVRDSKKVYSRTLTVIEGAGIATDAEIATATDRAPDDTTPTPLDPDAILSIPPPNLVIDSGVRRQLTYHWGPNPEDESKNGKSEGVEFCHLQRFNGDAPPTNEEDWVDVGAAEEMGLDHASPFIEKFPTLMTPQRVWVRARNMDREMNAGPWGQIEDGTVGP